MSLNAAFHPLRVKEVRRETRDAVSIAFEAPEELADLYRFQAGQYLTLKTDLEGEEVRRNYSVCVSPLDGELRIAVKEVAGGVFSRWANNVLKAGDTLDVMPPMGRFTCAPDPAAAHRYVGIAGGSGVTPLMSLIKTVLLTEPNSRFTLLYGNRNTASVIFLEELAGLKNRFMDRLEVYHFLEDEAEEIELFNGLLNREKCDEVFSTLVRPDEIDCFYICGPGPMMDAAEHALLAKGVSPHRIKIERFTTDALSGERLARAEALQQRAQGLSVEVTLDGRRAKVAFDAERGNILDSVRAAGLPAPFACKGGVCATCRAKVLSGSVEMKVNYGLSQDEVAQGYVLTCQSVPTSEDVRLSYDS
ncbi:MAG TPA: 1,2-phenylacetyl-CoA epoxidase subunit PaaE [Caulobacteraceae bacterium]|jgi:ring-1,2-phenylacetyl-CoA epoxidase subunit PaaE